MLRKSIAVAIGCLLFGTLRLAAQGLPPADPADADTEYSKGDTDIAPDILRSIPVAGPHRAFLPVSVDLKRFMPTPGRQGKLGSCQAWATGYAARAYYSARQEGRDPQDSRNQPSPNYLYLLATSKSDCSEGSTSSK